MISSPARRNGAPALASVLLTLLAAFGATLPRPATAATTLWHADSGILPDAMPCPWTRVSNTTPAPSLQSGYLLISTSTVSGNTYYQQIQSALAMPADSLVIEYRAQYISGTTTNSTRAAAAVEIESSAFRGTVVFLGANEVFFNSAAFTRGGTAAVATSDAVHLYRVVVVMTTNALRIYRDGVLILTGSTFFDNVSGSFAGYPRILWGEASSLAFGTSHWVSFFHNAAPGSGCGVTGSHRSTWGTLKSLYR